MPVYIDSRSMTVGQAKINSALTNAELAKTNPSGVIDFFEIDLEDILFDNLLLSDKVFNTDKLDNNRVFRFHNCLNFTSKTIKYQGKEYVAAPIFISEIEYNTKGILPRPKLFITTNEKGIESFSSLKNIIRTLGDLSKGKVVRRRTFLKFIDKENSPYLLQQIPNHEANPNALLRLDLFYFYRKTQENEVSLEYELSTRLDVDNVQIPRRTILQDKCVWTYRGEGCCYEATLKKDIHGIDSPNSAPSNAKNKDAVPVANISDIPFVRTGANITSVLPVGTKLKNRGLWEKNLSPTPSVGDYVFLEKNGIKYYFVCTLDNSENIAPPHIKYWTADQCSKSIQGCSLRFDFTKGLPFGGFAAVRKSGG